MAHRRGKISKKYIFLVLAIFLGIWMFFLFYTHEEKNGSKIKTVVNPSAKHFFNDEPNLFEKIYLKSSINMKGKDLNPGEIYVAFLSYLNNLLTCSIEAKEINQYQYVNFKKIDFLKKQFESDNVLKSWNEMILNNKFIVDEKQKYNSYVDFKIFTSIFGIDWENTRFFMEKAKKHKDSIHFLSNKKFTKNLPIDCTISFKNDFGMLELGEMPLATYFASLMSTYLIEDYEKLCLEISDLHNYLEMWYRFVLDKENTFINKNKITVIYEGVMNEPDTYLSLFRFVCKSLSAKIDNLIYKQDEINKQLDSSKNYKFNVSYAKKKISELVNVHYDIKDLYTLTYQVFTKNISSKYSYNSFTYIVYLNLFGKNPREFDVKNYWNIKYFENIELTDDLNKIYFETKHGKVKAAEWFNEVIIKTLLWMTNEGHKVNYDTYRSNA